MAESAAFSRRGIKGGAVLARLDSNIGLSTVGVVSADDLTTWANLTANGPARVMINRGGSTPEEIEISGVSGNNFTIVAGGRGLGGTSAAAHDAGETIEVISSPRDFDEANALVAKILGALAGNPLEFLRVNAGATDIEWAAMTAALVANTPAGNLVATTAQAAINELDTEKVPLALLTTQGDIPYATGANTWARLAKGTALQVLRMNAGATAPEWATIANDFDALANGVTTVPVSNTVTETNLLSYTLPGGTLAAGDMLRLTAAGDFLNNTGANRTPIWRVKFGATTLFIEDDNNYAASANRRAWRLQVELFAETTSAQRVVARLSVSDALAASTDMQILDADNVGYNTAAEATASDKALVFSVEHSAASASLDARLHAYKVELVKAA